MAQDRFKAAIQALTEDSNRQYYGLYPYQVKEVVTIGGTPHLGLEPEMEGLPQMVRIPVVMPHASYMYNSVVTGQDNETGTRILVGFIAGDPSKPVALPFFLTGMIGNVTDETFGNYLQRVTGNHTTTISGGGDLAGGNINENAAAEGTGASGGNINMLASAGGTQSSGGNINMTATSSGADTTGGNIRGTSRGDIRLTANQGIIRLAAATKEITLQTGGSGNHINLIATGNVVMQNGGRNAAREGDTVEITSISGQVFHPLIGTVSVVFGSVVGRITSGTNRVKLP